MFDNKYVNTDTSLKKSGISPMTLVYAVRFPWYKRLWYRLRRKPIPAYLPLENTDAAHKPFGIAIDDHTILVQGTITPSDDMTIE